MLFDSSTSPPAHLNQDVNLPPLPAARPAIAVTALPREEIELHVIRCGTPYGTPLVLIHGAGLTHHTFDNTIHALSLGSEVIAYDLRAHGNSGRNRESPYSHRQYVDDMIAVLESATTQRSTLVASSISALHAIQVAAERPDLVQSIVMIDIVPTIRREVIDGLRKFFRLSEFSSFESMVDKYGWFSGPLPPETIAAELIHGSVQKPDGTWTFNFDRALIDIVGAEQLAAFQDLVPALRCPVLLLRGEHSRVVPDSGIEQFRAALNPAVRFENAAISGGYHCPWRNNPQEFVKAVAEFSRRAA